MRLKFLPLATAGIAILSSAQVAAAQSGPETASVAPGADDAPLVSDDIVVTARRRDESIQDVPMVVQAVTGQELGKLNIREFQDVQSLVPGLSLQQSPGISGVQSSLRGIAFDVNASGNNGTIEFYLNDASVSGATLFMSMFDVGQIEVLRGPQGTLRGRASPSGSITVTTKRPVLEEAGGFLDTSINNRGEWNGTGAINVPIVAGKLGIRLAGVVDENDAGDVRSLNSAVKPSRSTRGIRASVQFNPLDILDLSFSYTGSSRDLIAYDQVESANLADPTLSPSPILIRGKDRRALTEYPRDFRQRFKVFNWQGEFRILGQKLNYVGAVNKIKSVSFDPEDPAAFFRGFPIAIAGAPPPTITDSTQKIHEIRLSSDQRVAGFIDYVAGFLSNRTDVPVETTTRTLIFAGVPSASPSNLFLTLNTPVNRTSSTNERSFFGNVTAHLGESTEISGGVRRISYHSEGELLINGAAVAAASENRTLHATIFQATARHRFNESFQIYANFGTSWRPGSATNPIIFRDNATPTPTLAALFFPEPERSKSYEIGFKSDLLDKRVRFNLSAYHQTFENYAFSSRGLIFGGRTAQGVNTVFVASPAIAVGVPAKVDGIEGEIQFSATSDWNLGLVAAYARSKIRNGTVPCNDYTPVDGQPDSTSALPTFAQVNSATGGRLVQFCQTNAGAGSTAPFSATVQSDYTRPMSDDVDGYLRGLMTYNGRSLNDPLNAVDDIKAYATVNLFAGVRAHDGSWEVGLFGKNIFNTQRALQRSASAATAAYRTFAGSVNAVTPYREVTYTPPREFGLTARVAFGSR